MLTREGAMKELASLPEPTSDSAATENPFCRDAHRGRRGGRAFIAQVFETNTFTVFLGFNKEKRWWGGGG